MDTDGKNVQKLTDGTLASEEPSWAPDGRSIVYVSMVDGSQTLHVINVAGGEPRQLTDHLGLDFSPEWAPTAFPVAPGSSTRLIQWGFLKQSINTWKDYRK
jgi:Tol biopolymer transport system component